MSAAVILGVETQIGLALIRELGRAGVRVVAMTHDPAAIGLASRYVSEKSLVRSQRCDEVIEAVNRLANDLGGVSLLTVSEANINWLNKVRDRFDSRVHLAVPRAEVMTRVLDKAITLEYARRVGIDTPFTLEVRSIEELKARSHDIAYPVVLKWSDANTVAPLLREAGLPLVKAEYVHSAAELLTVGERYAPMGQWPLIQEYCPGNGLGQFFFMHAGRSIRCFQHRRVAEWPPEGGFSSVCDSLPVDEHQELQDRSIALLQALEWEGVAMVEYRQDPLTGRCKLMEINGRFWGSLPLAVAAGAGFARLAHAVALGEPLPQLPRVRSGLRCRMISTEVKRLHRILLQPHLIADRGFRRRPVAEALRFLADFFRPGVRYYVWSLDDPWPAWRDLRNAINAGH